MYFIYLLLTLLSVHSTYGIWCYKCVSSQPGCGLYDFNILFHWSYSCADPNDKCVKVIERKGAQVFVTRNCLSEIRYLRRDIPADHYEGCRPAAADPAIAHYVTETIPELDIKRNHFDETEFCFCDFDERCNGVDSLVRPSVILLSTLILLCTMMNL